MAMARIDANAGPLLCGMLDIGVLMMNKVYQKTLEGGEGASPGSPCLDESNCRCPR